MKTAAILIASLLLTHIPLQLATAQATPPDRIAQDGSILTPQQVQQRAKNITVRITSENNGGSGVIIARKGDKYLILTNAHVIRRATKIAIQAPDGQKYAATPLDGGFDAKYDLALLQFTSRTKYTLPDLSGISGSPIETTRTIYSTGFPFDATNIRITKGQVSQLSDISFNDGTQIGYVTDKGEKGIRQGMSGGAILDQQGQLLGINTVGVAPILPDYTYNDGSKPIAKLKAQYQQANWGIPIYNFLTRVKPDILYGYDNLPKVEHQVTPTGYMARLNTKARQMTVRIETGGENGSGVIVARQGRTYYVLTAKHVVRDPNTKQQYPSPQIVTYDQDRRSATSTVVAEGVDLAVVRFESSNNYPVARLGEYSQNDGDVAFVGGFPGRLNINSPLWQWQLNPGAVRSREQGKLQTQTNESFADGYDLIYSSISYGGMSGGPVFDTVGNVIGIHGRAESANLGSLGISAQTFTGLASRLQVAPKLLTIDRANPPDLNPGDRQNILAAMQNIPQPQLADSGERWLAYANQLYRTAQYDRSIAAFDTAIAKNQALFGNYGKALSLGAIGKYQLAENAIDRAIAAIPSNERKKYYYFWGYQGRLAQSLEKYDKAIKSMDIAIQLEPNDLTWPNQKSQIFQDSKQYNKAIDIYNEIIQKRPEAYAYYNRGLAKSALGNKKEAIADYDRALAINPKDVVAYNNRGVVKSALGNKKEAIADYDRALAINPKYAEAYNNRGNAKDDLGDKKEAIADYDRAIAINPKHAEAYNNRGLVKSALGNKKEAIADYDRALAINPKYVVTYYNRGNAKSALGNKKEAIADYDRALAINPKYAEAYNNRGVAKSDLGNKQGAITDYDRAIAINSKYAEAYNNRGVAKSDLGNKQGAITDYDRAIAINSKYAEAYNNRGIAKSDLGNKQEAITDYDRAIAINSKYAEAYNNRGIAKSDLGNKQEAIADYDRAIAINPKYAEAYYNRGAIKSDLGNNKEAIVDFDRAIAINPQYTDAYYNRGIVKYQLGNKQGAITDFDRVIAINPKHAMAYYNRGVTKSELGNKKEAIADYDRAIAINPQYAMAYANRGNDKADSGDKQGAITDYDRAIAINPQYADAYYSRGNAKSHLGNKKEAIVDYDRVIAINPQYADAYLNRGNAKSHLGNKKEAIVDYDRAIAINPKYAEAYGNRGLTKSALGNNKEAIVDYDRAIAINPKYAEAYGNRGLTKSALGNNKEAITDLSTAAELFRQQGRMDLYQQAMDMLKKLKGG
jgi:tetratricopeptide (TPR) repeat protein/S1-C subfamily serine protease